MKNDANRTKILKVLGDSDVVKVRRSSTDPKKRSICVDGKTYQNPTGFDSALNDFLPSFEYVSTQIDPLEMSKYGRNTPIANMLSGVLSAILEKDPRYAAFKDQFEKLFTDPDSLVRMELDKLSGKVQIYLEKQFPDCERVVFEVSQPILEDLLKNFETSIDDGVYTSADEKGDGMQRALMLAIIQAYADYRRENEETSKFFMFFIDEAELHLHPTAQRKLKKALLDLANSGDQVFINTHSSVLISDNEDRQGIFKVEKNKGETNVSPIVDDEKPYIVYELLGGSPADLLLPKNFLVVEGKCELEFLARVITRHYPDKPKIQIIAAGGDLLQAARSLNAVEQTFKPIDASIYKERAVVYLDEQNNRTQVSTFLAQRPHLTTNNQFVESSAASIEEYYPAPWRPSATLLRAMTGPDKVALAIEAGNNIAKETFEAEMPQALLAIQRCWDLSFT